MDLQTVGLGAGALALIGAIGKWAVPILGRMLDNMSASVKASGGVLATVQAERDQWKKRAQDLDATLQAFREEWAEMKSRFGLLEYQLKEASETNARLTETNTKLLAELKMYREKPHV